MARFVASTLAFLAFAVAIVGGVISGNPPVEVLSKAIFALFLFFVLGLMLGGAAQLVISEYARQREAETDEFLQKLNARKDVDEKSPSLPETGPAGVA